MKYKDFSIKVGQKHAKGLAISVAAPAGEVNDFIASTGDLDEIFASLQSLAQSLRAGEAVSAPGAGSTGIEPAGTTRSPVVQPIDIGRKLFGILFAGRVRSLFDQSIGGIRGTDYGLRIKLHIDPENADIARLASLPWELLYREETRDYLCLSAKTPLVRYLDVQRPFELLPLIPPLRVLVVMANPAGLKPLDLEKERQGIEQAWGHKAGVEVDFLDTATIQELSKKLDEADYHVLHYMGHGGFDPKQGVGALAMEKEDGKKDLLDGRTLGIMLHDETSIRLVFLNACDTGKLGNLAGQDPFAGVATALVMAGVPAVVAMQFPISDPAALAFAECFYPQIAKGVPVDASVAEGRKAIRISYPKSMEWATPVLFMRSPDGHLFTGEATSLQPEEESKGGSGAKGKNGRTRALAIGAIAAVAVTIAAAVNFDAIRSWLAPADNTQTSTETARKSIDNGQAEEDRAEPDEVIKASTTEPANVDACGSFAELQRCKLPLAKKICAAYTALETDNSPVTPTQAELGSRRGNFLYTNEADSAAMTQFINNIRSTFQAAGGRDVQFAEFQDPKSFWRETPDASIVLSALLNTASPESGSGEIPDGESNIYYQDDLPLNVSFEVSGNKWRSVRNYHAAAFYYFDAISAQDVETKRNSLELAASRMIDRCTE